jgi:hypothetical protein
MASVAAEQEEVVRVIGQFRLDSLFSPQIGERRLVAGP